MNDIQPHLNFLHDYCDFFYPEHVWILKGISRNKDNTNVEHMHSFFRRMIITKPQDIDDCYREIHSLANDYKTTYRIYISLNSRNVVRTLFNFQKKLIDLSGNLSTNHPQEISKDLKSLKKVGSLWKTELEQRRNRGTKRVLLDVDDCVQLPKTIVDAIEQESEKIYCVRKTVSGWAIVFEACDTRNVMSICEEQNIDAQLHRDSMLFIQQFSS